MSRYSLKGDAEKADVVSRELVSMYSLKGDAEKSGE